MRSWLPIVGLIAIAFLFNILTQGRLLSPSNVELLLSQVYMLMIATTGVFFIITIGGLDFSQGSILGMASIAICVVSRFSIPLSLVAGMLTGAAMGAVNGFFHVGRKIRSFFVTICTMFLFRGVIAYLTSDSPIVATATMINYDTTLVKLSITLVVLAVAIFVYNFTKIGVQTKAIGSGEKAARFAGIKTDKIKFFIYVMAGAITGLAAFVNVVKVGSVTSSSGNQLETQILIALVLGGTPISGGAKSRISSVVIGSLLYIVLSSGLIMLGLTTEQQQLIQGIVFLTFVAIFADRSSLEVIK
ncbi:MAG: ABC transporter permease [Clostridiaceae bacterium]|nr:ABC transporter permease [Clostridiaceae bacterium]